MVTVPGFLVPGLLILGLLVPGFLVPGLLVPGLSTNSYTHSRPARKNTANQNLLRQNFIAYIFRSKRARVQECKSARERARERKRTRKQEKEWQNPVPFKENYPPPRTYYSLIGCSPSAQLSSRERQNTWRENCPCTCADYVYYLEHSCQRHLIMANVRAASHRIGTENVSLPSSRGMVFLFVTDLPCGSMFDSEAYVHLYQGGRAGLFHHQDSC